MSKRSESVKLWRVNYKKRMVKALGGKCCVCGYSKCNDSLALHHLDPKQKDFSFGKITGNPWAWERIVSEMRKCVLVCHNCHSEVHAGITVIPDNACRFDERYLNYRKQEKIDNGLMNKCPVCSKLKPISMTSCSRSCAAKLSRKVDWDNVDLESRLKNESINHIAESLDVSHAAVSKRMKKLNISIASLKGI